MGASVGRPPHLGDGVNAEELEAELTPEEKASLTAGGDVWRLPPIERLGIGRLKMSDGPSGVRGGQFGTRRWA